MSKTHAEVLKEHLENTDLQGEIKHLKYIWVETRKNFNKLMGEKIQELGYNPYFDLDGRKHYKLEISAMRKPEKEINAAIKKYTKPVPRYQRNDQI